MVVLWGRDIQSLPAFPDSVIFGKARAFPEFLLAWAELVAG